MLWSDPFSKMRLPTRRSRREPWRLEELRTLFSSAIFTQGDRPVTGKGEAAFWLPLMALFTGARLNELAPLTAADVITDAATDIVFINIKEDQEQGRRLKTVGSARLVDFCGSSIGYVLLASRLAYSRFSLPVARMASERCGRNGSAGTSGGSALRTK